MCKHAHCTCMCVCHYVYSSVTDGGTSTGYLQSVQHVLADISEVCVLESAVALMELGYSGTCDCIATYRLEVHVSVLAITLSVKLAGKLDQSVLIGILFVY